MDKEHFYSAINKMNLNITPEERCAVNDYRFKLWMLADKLRDKSNLPSVFEIFMNGQNIANEFRELIALFPVMFGNETDDYLLCNKCSLEDHEGQFCRCESRNIRIAKEKRKREDNRTGKECKDH